MILLAALVLGAVALSACGAASARRGDVALVSPDSASYVAGSTKEVCVLTGHGETYTATDYGLMSADLGYSFLYHGSLWFLFGDSLATQQFDGQLNQATRWPQDLRSLVNDSIAFAAPTAPGMCSELHFVTEAPVVRRYHATYPYADPYLRYRGRPVSLRTDESPNSGIAVGGKMYVLFAINNPDGACTLVSVKEHPKICPGIGYSYSSVMAVLDPEPGVPLHFRGLYTFSGPRPGAPLCASTPAAPGKFVNVAIASGPGGYLYFWGTRGGDKSDNNKKGCHVGTQYYRHSDVYLARMKAVNIGKASSGGGPKGIEYFNGKRFVAGTSEKMATALFTDKPPCMGELGVQYNQIVKRWMMLYNCLDHTAASPRGIWMRTAPYPWGPWTAPQTIFNPSPSDGYGYCYLIHSTGTCPLGSHNPPGVIEGGDYGPYFISGWTTGAPATSTTPATSTIYYTVSTFSPYGQVIMKSTIQGPLPQHQPCKGTTC